MVLPVDLQDSLVLIPDQLINQMSEELSQFYILSHEMLHGKNDSSICVNLKLKRIFSYHLTNTYMPTTTLLIIAEITLHFDETKTEVLSNYTKAFLIPF